MQGYLTDYMKKSSSSSGGGYLDGLRDPNFDAIYGAGGGGNDIDRISGQPKSAGLWPSVGQLNSMFGGFDAAVTDNTNRAQYQQQMQMANKLSPLYAEGEIASNMAKQKAQSEYAMMKAQAQIQQKQSEEEWRRQMMMQDRGYLDDLMKQRYSTYLGYGI